MSALRNRSKYGCLTCKNRRKKCDEVRPECNRCKSAGMECLGYSHLDHYVPKPRRPRIKSHVLTSTTVALPPTVSASQTAESSVSAVPEGYFSSAEPNLLVVNSGVCTNDSWRLSGDPWQTYLGLSDISSLDTLPEISGQIQLALLSQPIGRDAASYWWDPNLLSQGGLLELTNEGMGRHTGRYSPANIAYGKSAPEVTLDTTSLPSNTLRDFTQNQQHVAQRQPSTSQRLFSLNHFLAEAAPYSSSTWRPLQPMDPDKYSDTEGVMSITLSPGLDRNSPDNSLPFTLSICFRWIIQSMFEPLKVAPSTKDMIVRRYMSSADSRSGAIRITRAMEALLKDPFIAFQNLPELGELECQTHYRIRLVKSTQKPLPESHVSDILAALHHAHELLVVRGLLSPMSYNVTMLREVAPLYRQACSEPDGAPLNLPTQLMHPETVLRHFPAMDIVTSLMTGLPMIFRYEVNCIPELLYQHVADFRTAGLQYMHGIPDEFLIMIARIHMLRGDTTPGSLNPRVVEGLEEKIRTFKPVINDSPDSYLKIARLMVHEVWRQAMYIYLYMGLCGSSSDDTRTVTAVKQFVRLLGGVKPGRTPDIFLFITIGVVGVAARKRRHRSILRQRILGIPECTRMGTIGNDTVRTLDELWATCDQQGQPSVWGDLRAACAKVTGIV